MKMKPVIILPRRSMSKKDIQSLRDNDFLVVEAADPSIVRFAEPPPLGYSVQEQAAIKLCRMIMKNPHRGFYGELATKLAEILVEGSPLAPIEKANK